jgi:predicted lactoylglutathione lyase
MKLEFPAAVPEIPVSDLDTAIPYYQSNLGFNLDWREDSIGLAGISRDNCRLFLASTEFRKARRNVGPVLTWLNLNSKEEVNELCRLWTTNNAMIVSGPESKPWGLHEFTAKDPDGNLFRVFYDFATADRTE